MTIGPDAAVLAAESPVVSSRRAANLAFAVLIGCLSVSSSGCWAPLRSYGVPARLLPDSFRTPMRTAGLPLNYSNLTIQPPADYILGPNDILEITIPGLFEGAEVHPLRVQVMASGEIHLPMVGPVVVGDKNLLQAQQDITDAYADDFLVNPRISIALAEKSTTSVIVLGKVKLPGVHILPKFENDVGHALAAAGGLLEDSGDVIEIHRRIPQNSMRPSNLAATNNHTDHAVEMAAFRDDPSGFSFWNLDDETRPPGPNDHTTLPLVPPSQTSQVAQPLADPQPSLTLSHLRPSEPWPAPVSRPARGNVPQSPSAVAGQTASAPWQAPAATPPAPVAIASQPNDLPGVKLLPVPEWHVHAMQVHGEIYGDKQILRIPLRQIGPTQISSEDIRLKPGDVVVVPSRRHEVFFVVGRLSTTNNVRFTIGDREREIGVGFILPREREIDVVTAVVMAGYIDPIDSPTTVTVHRTGPDGHPFLIHVDLIKARYDARETVLVQAGDIIYLNPDSAWWWRRTFDRVVPDLITLQFTKLLGFK